MAQNWLNQQQERFLPIWVRWDLKAATKSVQHSLKVATNSIVLELVAADVCVVTIASDIS